MREIEFRGIDKVTGKWVYGYYAPFFGIPMIEVDSAQGKCEIIPETLGQLIAVDKNDKKVFEDDRVIRVLEWSDEDNEYVPVGGRYPMPAAFDDYAAILNGEVVLSEAKKCFSSTKG